MLYRMLKHVCESQEAEPTELRSALEIFSVVLQNLKGKLDPSHLAAFVPLFMNRVCGTVVTTDGKEVPRTKSRITKVEFLTDVVATGFWFNPLEFLRVLETNGWTKQIFELWFEMVPHLQRRKDKKMSILALSSLLTLEAHQLPQLVTGCFPAAVEHATQLCLELHELGDPDDEDDEDNEALIGSMLGDSKYAYADGDDDDGELDSDQDDDKQEDADYLQLLAAKIKAAEENGYAAEADDDEDEWEEFCIEEPSTSPIDDVDPYVYFRQSLEGSSVAKPLVEVLAQETKAAVQNVFVIAEQRPRTSP